MIQLFTRIFGSLGRFASKNGTALLSAVPKAIGSAPGAGGKIRKLGSALFSMMDVGLTAYFIYDLFNGSDSNDDAKDASLLNAVVLSRPIITAIHSDYADRDAVADAFTNAAISAQGMNTESGNVIAFARFACADYILRTPSSESILYSTNEMKTTLTRAIDESQDPEFLSGSDKLFEEIKFDELTPLELKAFDFYTHFINFVRMHHDAEPASAVSQNLSDVTTPKRIILN